MVIIYKNYSDFGDTRFDNYRIPSIIKYKNKLYAFAEARAGNSDSGYIATIVKILEDGVWKDSHLFNFEKDALGNPCAVADENVIHLLLTHNKADLHEEEIIDGKGVRTPYYTYSTDGINWAKLQKLDIIRRNNWRWYATGPGNGIKLRNEKLAFPCNHTDENKEHHSHIVYFENGEWTIGQIQKKGTNESAILEIDGKILQMMRNQLSFYKVFSFVFDDHSEGCDIELKSAICQASIIRFKNYILISSPAFTHRTNLTIWIFNLRLKLVSRRTVYLGCSAYSSMVNLDEDHFGILYERDGYNKIVYEEFDTEWLLDQTKFPKWFYDQEEFSKDNCEYIESMFLHNTENDEYNIEINGNLYKLNFSKMILVKLDEFYMVQTDPHKYHSMKLTRI